MRRAAWAVTVFALAGCQDAVSGGASSDPRALSDARVRAQTDALVFLDLGPRATPDVGGLDAGRRDGGSAGGPCHTLGLRRCPAEGGHRQLVCQADNLWHEAQCPGDLVCFGGQCRPPEGCEEGARSCGQDRVLRCEGGEWRPFASCGEGELCAGGRCMTPACAGAAQSRSYVGCEYWPVDLQAYRVRGQEAPVIDNAPMGLVLFNPSAETEARLTLRDPEGEIAETLPTYQMSLPAGSGLPPDVYPPTLLRTIVTDAQGARIGEPLSRAQNLAVPPGGWATLLLPRRGFAQISSSVRADAWRLTSTAPVVAYQFNPMCCNYSFSNDASLLIPASALGRLYRFIGVPAQSEGGAEMAVAATEDDTEVTLRLPPRAEVSPDEAGRLHFDGRTITLSLARHEVAMIHVAQGPFDAVQRDLTGVQVESSAPVAVFSGHQCARAPARLGACDHLEEQLFPTEAWGRAFSLAPLAPRADPPLATEVIYWKILADRDHTRILLSAPFASLQALPPANVGAVDCAALLTEEAALNLDAGESCEFGSARPVGLDANAPLLVAGVLSGQLSTGAQEGVGAHAGDPSLFLVAPDRQHRRDYVFLTPETYADGYVTVVVETRSTLTLDGAEVDLSRGRPIPGRDRLYLHVPLADGPHRIVGSAAFGVVVYAYDDFVSYAFTGGLNLEKE